ncbi:MAG: bifunctional oligoribonuclease/PAP phosphatase NrnA [Ignavibacteria bacterium]|nr:bifunctional oligoribonuclease/PAP phosphatase NrnA [Ignavibacteria bacterium]
MLNSAIKAILPLFTEHNRFVLSTHVNPDGDGLGSEIALAEWLQSKGKEVHILNHDAPPALYLFLDPHKVIQQYVHADHADMIAGTDVLVVLDTNHPGRLGSMEPAVTASRAVKVCIDHHLDPASFADHYVVDQEASSTGELVYRILTEADPPEAISPAIARALYCAIMTDTGSFRYSHVDPELHSIVGDLIARGADPGNIYREIYEQWSPGRIRLLGETLATLDLAYQGLLAHITIDQAMLRRTGTVESDTDNFTIYPMSIQGVEAGILFLELNDGVKMSLRSRAEIPMNELAKEFGGGGHRNAAGARMQNVGLESFKRDVLRAAGKYLQHEQRKQ